MKMRSPLGLIVGVAFSFLGLTISGFAQDPSFKDLPLNGKGILHFEKGPVKPETVGRFDKLILLPASGTASPEKDGKVIYETQGAVLKHMEVGDLDGDGVPELLLTLDPGGGSGGFIDFTLLTASGTTYDVRWEESGYKNGQASIVKNKDSGTPEIVINFVEVIDPKAEPASKTAVFFMKDGKVSSAGGEKPPAPPAPQGW